MSRSVKTRAAIALPAEFVDAVADRVAELMADRITTEPEPWIGVEQACAHLDCSRQRIYDLVSLRRIPFAKEGNRLLFKRSELDEWVASGGARAR